MHDARVCHVMLPTVFFSDRKGLRAVIAKGLIDAGPVPPVIKMETTKEAIENTGL